MSDYIAKVRKDGAVFEAEFVAHSQNELRPNADKAIREAHGDKGIKRAMCWSPKATAGDDVVCRWKSKD